MSKLGTRNKVSDENHIPFDIDMLVALRLETRKCTKHHLNPILNFLSFEKCSSFHKNFLMSLNAIFVPKTLHETLNYKEPKML